MRESQGLRGAPWRRLGGAGEAGGGRRSRRWPGRVAARAGRVPVLLAKEEGDRGVAVAGWAGQLQCWAGLATR